MKTRGYKKKDWSVDLKNIKTFVESKYLIDLSERVRSRYNTEARALYYMIALDKTMASLAHIGCFVGRDHATVMHSRNSFHLYEKLPMFDKYYREFMGDPFQAITEEKKEEVIELNETLSDNDLPHLTDNEIRYRSLTDSQKAVYDERASLMLKSFDWQVVEEFETISCQD